MGTVLDCLILCKYTMWMRRARLTCPGAGHLKRSQIWFVGNGWRLFYLLQKKDFPDRYKLSENHKSFLSVWEKYQTSCFK
jgi:hypothetical protein